MNLQKFPTEIAETILYRSVCAVQVGSCIADSTGIYAVGWNHSGSGYGMHAEEHCLRRSNKSRWKESTLYVAAVRRKSGNIVTAKPCIECAKRIAKVGAVMYRDGTGEWVRL